MIQPYFEVFECLSATSKLMGDNKEFNDSAIFWGILLIVVRGNLQIIEDS